MTRFSTQKYTLQNIKNKYIHLTNSSINKHAANLTHDKNVVGVGSKWTLAKLREYFKQIDIDFNKIFKEIELVVILTLLSVCQDVPAQGTQNCFEFFGFDILIDSNLKPWLIEINGPPALAIDCDVDRKVKP